MKKFLLLALSLLSLWFTFASRECATFSAGDLCLDLKNNWNGNYSVKKQFTKRVDKTMITLSCRILTPDGYLKEMWSCDGNFDYSAKWNYKIDYYINLEWQWKIIHWNYYFDPSGQIDTSSSTVVVDKSAWTAWTSTNSSSNSSSDDSYDYSNSSDYDTSLSTKNMETIKTVHDMWQRLIISLANKYPNLKSNTQWGSYQMYIYDQMEALLNGQKTDIKSYADFRVYIVNFIRMTKNSR